MFARSYLAVAIAAGGTALAGCGAGDQGVASAGGADAGGLPEVIPVSAFFDNPEIAGAQISPDGEWLSYLKAYQGKLNVHVRRVGSDEEIQITADTVRPVTQYFWSIDGSKVLYAQDRGGNENFHVFAAPIDGTPLPDARDLTPFEDTRAIIFAVPEDAPERILVGLNRRNPQVFDPYWLDLASGDLALVTENPGRHSAYLLDHELTLRVATGQNMQGGTDIFARPDETSDWELIVSYPPDENVSAVQFHKDNRRLYITTDHGDVDLSRLALMDLETGEVETVESDPEGEVDFGSAVFSGLTDELIATLYVADTVRYYFKDPEWAEDFGDLRQLHDGSPNLTSTTLDERTLVVSFDDPADPGATYLYDRDSGEAEFLFRPRPWLEEYRLADMRPVSFEARDGLTIHGYLSTPPGVAAENLPMVLLVHGGPWARDNWGFDSEAQLLANRGYAVLQVNYRGSTGYGKAFLNAAVKEWAGAMHEDLVDGVQWAIDEGIADPARIGIYGGSYGGYATLVGLTFTPEVFACGLDYVGPSSLVTLIESFPAYWRPFLEGTFYRHVGDPSNVNDIEDMQARSPLNFVDRIEDPIMIVQGANDPRVTKRESDQMVVALRDRGIPVTYLLAENEGHGFANADNRMALYRSMEVFFGQCLGGRVDPNPDPAIEAQIAKLTVDPGSITLPEATGQEQ